MSDRGRLIVFAAPAGAGKSTIIAALRERHPDWGFSVSATTRAPRPGEQDGREYYFLTRAEFLKRVAAGEFFEHEDVHGELYGTLRGPTDERLARGETLIFDLDVLGALNLKAAYPEALSIFVQPPSADVLKERLTKRNTESQAQLERRLSRVEMERSRAREFDVQITNDNLERAVELAEEHIRRRFDHSM